jgi:hypothetical protein
LAHQQLIHILQHCRHKCPKAQMSDFNRQLRSHNLQTCLAHLIPNQHTLTCRSINDSVLKQPANPHIEDILGSYPFLSPPLNKSTQDLYNTAACEAKTLFHGSFITKVHLLGLERMRKRGERTGNHHPFRYLKQARTQDLAPQQPATLSSCSVLSASLHVVGKVLWLPTF